MSEHHDTIIEYNCKLCLLYANEHHKVDFQYYLYNAVFHEKLTV